MSFADIVKGRLLDFDDKVRTQAVITLCDLFKSNLECIPQSSELILKVTDRLRDKKVRFCGKRILLAYDMMLILLCSVFLLGVC